MSGYTPVFSDIYMGSLYGRWPTAAVWASLLPLMDKHGHIDMSMPAIAGITGWPLDLLEKGISDLMQPDPGSRSQDEEGRRLVPISPDRPWGWKAVNHGKYREKARKAASDSRRAETGENADRMKARRAETRDDPTRPAETRDDPPSNTNTNTNTEDKKHPSASPPAVVDSPDVQRVFDHWCHVHEHHKAKLDDRRRKAIRSALKLYSADDLCLSISGYRNSEFHMGKNDSGIRHDSILLLLRDADHIDRGLALAKQGKKEKWQ